jgi:hypothetical protein
MINLPPFFDSNLSKARELYSSFPKSNGSSQSETIPSALPLELGKTNLPTRFYSSIKILESSMKVSKGFLWCTLGTFVHPRKLTLFQTVQQFVLLHSISELVYSFIVLVESNSLFKAPVVGESSDSSMLKKRTPLGVIRV